VGEKLNSAVGKPPALNSVKDQQVVIDLLNDVLEGSEVTPIPRVPLMHGKASDKLLNAITWFQARFVSPPFRDGRIDPNGESLRELVRISSGSVKVGPAQFPMGPTTAGGEEVMSGLDANQAKLNPIYIDNVKSGEYDVPSGTFTINHNDGTRIELPFQQILKGIQGAKSPGASFLVFVKRGCKIYPTLYTPQTAPNISAIVQDLVPAIGPAKDLNAAILFITEHILPLSGAQMGPKPPRRWMVAPKQRCAAPRCRSCESFGTSVSRLS
jgi:hypothetical protein